jgi:hypothetical protein
MDTPPATQAQLIELSNVTSTGQPLLSPGLKKLLTEGEDGGGACRIIRLNAKLREECERALPVLVQAKAPADRVEILRILVEQTPQYGIKAQHAGEWSRFFAAYLDALEGLPGYAVEDAFVRWNRGEGHKDVTWATVYPTSAQLYMLAQKAKAELYVATYRAEKALAEAEKAAPRHISEADRAKNAETIAAMLREPVKKLPPQPPGVTYREWAEKCRREGLYEEPPTTVYRGETPQQAAERIRRAIPVDVQPTDDVGDVV